MPTEALDAYLSILLESINEGLFSKSCGSISKALLETVRARKVSAEEKAKADAPKIAELEAARAQTEAAAEEKVKADVANIAELSCEHLTVLSRSKVKSAVGSNQVNLFPRKCSIRFDTRALTTSTLCY